MEDNTPTRREYTNLQKVHYVTEGMLEDRRKLKTEFNINNNLVDVLLSVQRMKMAELSGSMTNVQMYEKDVLQKIPNETKVQAEKLIEYFKYYYRTLERCLDKPDDRNIHKHVEGIYNPLQVIRNRVLKKKYHDRTKSNLFNIEAPLIASKEFSKKKHKEFPWLVEINEIANDLVWRTSHWNELVDFRYKKIYPSCSYKQGICDGSAIDKNRDIEKKKSLKRTKYDNILIHPTKEDDIKKCSMVRIVSPSPSVFKNRSRFTYMNENKSFDDFNSYNKKQKSLERRKSNSESIIYNPSEQYELDDKLYKNWLAIRFLSVSCAVAKHEIITKRVFRKSQLAKRNTIKLDFGYKSISSRTSQLLKVALKLEHKVLRTCHFFKNQWIDIYIVSAEGLLFTTDRTMSEITTTMTLQLKSFQDRFDKFETMETDRYAGVTRVTNGILELFIRALLLIIWLFVTVSKQIKNAVSMTIGVLLWVVW